MANVRITCITKSGDGSSCDCITHVGGTGGGGWRWTTARVVDSIEKKTNTFYTLVDGNRASVGVVNGQSGKYLRTYADGEWNDNLLALPSCPA
jgi:hypothetical protein